MKINQIDTGASHPWAMPIVGQNVTSVTVEGSEPVIWAHGSIERKQTVNFTLASWQGLGGFAANTSGATKYLCKQLEELCSNGAMHPVYIQWNSTDDPTALYTATELHDGWYDVDDFEPDYGKNIVSGKVACLMTVTEVAPPAPSLLKLDYKGGPLTSPFSGTELNLVSLPIGAIAHETSVSRTGAEGTIPCILSPIALPEPWLASATIANLFKGGVHVYDTLNTGTNPVPVAGGGFVHANWVEVFFTRHNFVGDCVITNGLHLLLFVAGSTNICSCYIWNFALAAPNWLLWATLNHKDNAGNLGTLRGYTFSRVGPEESGISTVLSTSGGKASQLNLRLQRGRYDVRFDFKPLVETSTSVSAISLIFVANAKIAYNTIGVADSAIPDASPLMNADYGYAAAFIASTAQPVIGGFLYSQFSGSQQPHVDGPATISLGDTLAIIPGAQRAYGFFAVPYGVFGNHSPANLQAEAESGTLGTGWTSQAGAGGNSNALEAKCASGTVATNADTFGTAFIPTAGTYDIWFRVKVTTGTSAVSQMQLGLYNSTDSVFMGSTIYKPNQVTTAYQWIKVAAAVLPTAGKSMRFRAVTTATLDDNWFIDEAIMAPQTIAADLRGPQEIWQHWAYDRSTRWLPQ